MKRKGLIAFDVIMSLIIMLNVCMSLLARNYQIGFLTSKSMAGNGTKSVDVVVTPELQRACAGDTVTLDISLENINMGDEGLNNIVGFLSYDDSIFEEVNMTGEEDWVAELNQNKSHELYGKFAIYTMKIGETADQSIAKLTLKLKANIPEQGTEINFTNLKTSDSEASVNVQQRAARIEVEKQSPDEPDEPVTPDEPVNPDEPGKEDDSDNKKSSGSDEKKNEEKGETHGPKSIKTDDAILLIALALTMATIGVNIIVLVTSNDDERRNVFTRRVGTISALAFIILGLTMVFTVSFAHNAEMTNLINSLTGDETWLNSDKYLVTDENISRIAPSTNIDNFKNKFNKALTVFDRESSGEVVSGIVATGMLANSEGETKAISVLGDVSGDGDADGVDLTRIIRNVKDSTTYTFTSLETLSGDVYVDGFIDRADVTTLVRYIVYGELNIPTFSAVTAPKIEVIGGTYNENIQAYEDTIRVQISKQDSNATSTKYKVEGSEPVAYTTIENGGIIEFPNNGVYKISAYSYGRLGNRSDIPNTIVIKKNATNTYKVKKLTEQNDGTFVETTETKTGRIGETVRITDAVPEGYEIDEENSTLEGVVSENEEIELVVKYQKQTYALTLNAGDYVSSVSIGEESNASTITKRFKQGTNVNIAAVLNSAAGYTYTFDRWISSDTDVLADIATQTATITMPTSNITLTAKANRANNDDTQYTVNYYYQSNGAYSETPTSSVSRAGTTDATVAVTATDKTATQAGYVYDSDAANIERASIAGDGSTVLKLYFKQQFTVTYAPGTHGAFTAQVTENLDYGAITPVFSGEKTAQEGYEFTAWDKTVENTVTKSETYTATWNTVDYAITYNYADGQLPEGKINAVNYNIETETFTLENPVRTGYIFAGWTGSGLENPTITVTVAAGSTGAKSYTATWTPATDTDYKVEHYTEKLDGSYELYATDDEEGTTESTVTATSKEISGFTFDSENENNKLSDTVAADGTTVLKVYYTRNSYELALTKDENIASVTGAGTYKYGSTVEITATPKTETGYTITFNEWVTDCTTILTGEGDKKNTTATFEMPAEAVTINATATKTANDVDYIVEKYFQVNGSYGTVADSSETRAGKTATIVEATAADKTTDQAGYVYDSNAAEKVESASIEGDGSTVLKLYFKQQFTVTYAPGTHGAFTAQVTENLDYGAITPVFSGEKTAQEGYEFTAWDKTVENTVTKSETYTATWNTVDYTITYNYADGQLPEGKTNPVHYNIETETFTLNNPVRTGYTFAGWTGTGLDEATETVTITAGNTGARAYTATWIATEYDITYTLNGGKLPLGITNPSKYNVESSFTLNNPSKDGYTFLGWTGTDLSEATETVTVATGNTGNRAYEANWEAISGVTYHVKYFGENFDGTDYILLENKELSGVTDESITTTAKEFTGFTFDADNSGNVMSGTIAADGSTVLKVYYTRNSYELALTKDENIASVTGAGTYKYGSTVEITATPKTETGYTITFNEWVTDCTTILTGEGDKKNTTATFEMPAEAVTINATATKTANDVDYIVEKYFQVNGSYGTVADSSETRAGKTATIVEVTAADKTTDRTGYEYDTAAANVESAEIAGDGSTILKLYFKQQFTITYVPGAHGTFASQTTEHIDYGATTPAFIGEKTAQAGYEFKAWDKTVENTVTKSETYTATWNTVDYEITYNLADGELPTGKTNPTSYNVETETFTLNNPVRTGYIFAGWTGTGLENPTITVAVATGSTYARAYTATWSPATDTAYTVEHYTEKLDGTFELNSTDNEQGTTGATVAAIAKTIEGFTFDEDNENNVLSASIVGDGSTVLKVYYTRNSYELALTKDENIASVTGAGTYKYGSTVEITATPKTETGYTITFNEWVTDCTTILTGEGDKKNTTATFEMPAEAVTINATATKTANDVDYIVEKYFQVNGSYGTVADSSETRAGKTATIVEVTAADKTTDRTGYEYDTAAANVESAEIAGDGSTILKLYFKQQFTITYVPGAHGTFASQTTEHIDYGATTPAFIGEKTAQAGYEFKAWDKTVENTVTKSETYTATWNTVDYEITYNLADGELPTGKTNPTSYNVETETFTLNNPVRTGYIFAGWIGTGLENPTITVTVATGSTYARAYTATWSPVTDTAYKVGHYTEKLDGTFELNSTDNEQGTTGTTATATSKTIEGFTFDEDNENNVLSATIAADGSTVLKVYYTRNSYELALTKDENIASVTGAGTYKYGSTVEITATPKTETGYTITFNEWVTDCTTILTGEGDKKNTTATFEMPAEAVTINATATKTANDVDYIVEKYFQVNGSYGTVADSSETRAGKTATIAEVTAADKTTDQAGYIYDSNATGKVESASIAADGSTVLKLYFKQQFTVTYNPGEHGTFETQTTSNLDYNAETPAFSGEKTCDIGYEFNGWDKAIADKVTEDAQYTATWKASTGIAYHVKHYVENLNSTDSSNPDNYTEQDDESLTGTTNAEVTATAKTYTGFTYDADNTNNVLTGTVAGDGSTVLKVYYTRDSYTVTLNANGGKLTVDENEVDTTDKVYKYGSKYGTLPTPAKEGYSFVGWTEKNYELPSEYQEVEYIESTGSQYINTEYYADINTKLEIETMVTDTSTDNKYPQITGARNYYHASSAIQVAYSLRDNCVVIDYGNAGNTAVEAGKNKKINITIENNAHYVNNIMSEQTGTFSGKSSYPLWIFDDNNCGSGEQKYIGRIYSYKIYESGVLVRNFVPCYRKSDNTIGLYDTVEGKLYTNIGSGTFLKGENVGYITETSDLVANEDHTLYARWKADGLTVENYGQTVNYSVEVNDTTLNNWKLFMIDNDGYAYVIYGDYLPNAAIPQAAIDEGHLSTDGTYRVWSKTNRTDLINSMTNSSNWSSFVSSSLQAAAANAGETVTVTGGPTVTQFKKSWNDQYTSGQVIVTGNEISGWSTQGLSGTTGYSVAESNNMYFPHKSVVSDGSNSVQGYLLASPSNYNEFRVMYVNCNSVLDNDGSGGADKAFRPLVRLPSSILEYNSETNKCDIKMPDTATYHVEHYLENIDSNDSSNPDNYTIEENEELTGYASVSATATAKTYTGYTFDSTNNNNVLTANIAADGSTVLKLFYTRDSYTVTLNANGGKLTVDGNEVNTTDKIYKYGSKYGILPTPTREGYSFGGWCSGSDLHNLPEEYQEVEYIKFDGNQYVDTGVIPTNHTTEIQFDFDEYNNGEILFGTSLGGWYYHFTAYNDTYYYGGNGFGDASGGTWTTGKHTLVYNDASNSVKLDGERLVDNRNFAATANLMIGKCENENDWLRGNVYYAKIIDKSTGHNVREFIPCYRKSDDAVGFYDTVTKNFYTNNGTGEFKKGKNVVIVEENTNLCIDEDHTLYASWTLKTDTEYKVEFYYQENGVYPENPGETNTDTRTGTTGETATVTDEDKVPTQTGYIYDTNASNVESSTILGNGTTTLKLYFKQQFTVTYDPGAHGTFETQTTSNLDYNADTPLFSGEKTCDIGYEFNGWDKAIADKVTEDVVYTATWVIGTMTGEDIVPENNYGDKVAYSVNVNGTDLDDWRLFMTEEDENNKKYAYLIYGDYLPVAQIPQDAIDGEGLLTAEPYNVCSGIERSQLLNAMLNNEYWSDFITSDLAKSADIVEGDAKAYGSATADQFKKS